MFQGVSLLSLLPSKITSLRPLEASCGLSLGSRLLGGSAPDGLTGPRASKPGVRELSPLEPCAWRLSWETVLSHQQIPGIDFLSRYKTGILKFLKSRITSFSQRRVSSIQACVLSAFSLRRQTPDKRADHLLTWP